MAYPYVSDREVRLLSTYFGDPKQRHIETYVKRGGYSALEKALGMGPDDVVEIGKSAGLRGRGGAGFPTGVKWSFMPKEKKKAHYLLCNADESEPGTFKDRYIMERDPHNLLEGIIIAAYAIDSHKAYVYLRGEYFRSADRLQRAIDEASSQGWLGENIQGTGFDLDVVIHRGAGAYICGEESAMLESLEGKRGEPRHKPPFPAEIGLFGRPTLIHNVETLYWVPKILTKGAAWFARQGRRGRHGLRLFSVSGRVKEPGVKLAPAGVSALELIEEYAGGMQPGHQFKAYLPGGASGGILPARLANIALDFGTLDEYGCIVGSAAVVILSDHDAISDVVLNLMRFFEDESCGQCTPCRVGCEKAVKLMERPEWDEALLRELSVAMADASICGLGQAAPNPLLRAFEFFREELPI